MNSTLVAFASKQEFNLVYPQISAVVAMSTPIPIGLKFDVTVCGIGILDFATNLSYQLSKQKYERVILVGVCGAYPNRDLNLCDVVRVSSDIIGDMGFQTPEGHFNPWGDSNGERKIYTEDSPRLLTLPLASIRSVAGVTVNCCTGTDYLSYKRSQLFNADIESMEGASCFSVCKRFGVSAYQFRSVSNIATNRDLSLWKIPEAMNAIKLAVLDNLV